MSRLKFIVILFFYSTRYFTVMPLTYMTCTLGRAGVQRLSDRVLDSRPNGRGFQPHRRHCVASLSKNIKPGLVLVQPRKTRPFITERLLMGRKESNQTSHVLWLNWTLVSSMCIRTINEDPDQSTHVRWLNWTLVSSNYPRTINEDPDQSTNMRWLNWTSVSSMYLHTINEDPKPVIIFYNCKIY